MNFRRALPSALVELVQEYRGAIRAKNGKVLFHNYGDEKNRYSATVEPGLWFIRRMPVKYSSKGTFFTMVIARDGTREYKEDEHPMRWNSTGFAAQLDGTLLNTINALYDYKEVFCTINPNYIVLKEWRYGDIEKEMDSRAQQECFSALCESVKTAVQTLLPNSKMNESPFSLELEDEKSENEKKAFPLLYEQYRAIKKITIYGCGEENPEVLLERAMFDDLEMSCYIPKELLYGGVLEKLVCNVKTLPEYESIFCSLMLAMATMDSH